jgi:hypothetical protein
MSCKKLVEALLAAEAIAQQEYEGGSLAGLLNRLGGVSPRRVRWTPLPGTATAEDVTRLRETEGRIYELIEGTLVEKTSDTEDPPGQPAAKPAKPPKAVGGKKPQKRK